MQIDRAARRLHLAPSDPAFVQDPYPAFDAARAAGPALFWEQYGHWCVFDHAGVSAALRDRRLGRAALPDAPPPPEHTLPFWRIDRLGMLEREPPDHTRLRGSVNRAFVSGQIERLRPVVAALAHETLDRIAPAGRCELIEAFAAVIPVAVIAELLGVPEIGTGRLLDWSHRMVAMYRINRSRAEEDAAVAAAVAFDGALRDLLSERRRRPGIGLIDAMIAAQQNDAGLSDDELVANGILLLNAGHEATVHAIGNAVRLLLDGVADPAVLSGPVAPGLVEELVRLDTPLQMFTRTASEDCVVAGVALRRGERIGLMLGAACRDPAAFPEPDRARPGRAGAPHAAFGGGIHFCIGAPLARMELQVVLPILFERLPGLELAAPPRFADSFHFRGLEALELRWRPAQ